MDACCTKSVPLPFPELCPQNARDYTHLHLPLGGNLPYSAAVWVFYGSRTKRAACIYYPQVGYAGKTSASHPRTDVGSPKPGPICLPSDRFPARLKPTYRGARPVWAIIVTALRYKQGPALYARTTSFTPSSVVYSSATDSVTCSRNLVFTDSVSPLLNATVIDRGRLFTYRPRLPGTID